MGLFSNLNPAVRGAADRDWVIFLGSLRLDQLLAMSRITWELTQNETGTTLVVADRVTLLAGQGPIDGCRDGDTAVLDRLAAHLAR